MSTNTILWNKAQFLSHPSHEMLPLIFVQGSHAKTAVQLGHKPQFFISVIRVALAYQIDSTLISESPISSSENGCVCPIEVKLPEPKVTCKSLQYLINASYKIQLPRNDYVSTGAWTCKISRLLSTDSCMPHLIEFSLIYSFAPPFKVSCTETLIISTHIHAFWFNDSLGPSIVWHSIISFHRKNNTSD